MRFDLDAIYFKLKCFKPEEENRLYEEKFKKIVLIWRRHRFIGLILSLKMGKCDLKRIACLSIEEFRLNFPWSFCRANDIELKGHPLYWQAMVPDWLPGDFEEIKTISYETIGSDCGAL